jgi:hypothetical protein
MAIPSPIGGAFGVSVAEMKAPSREDAARSLGRAGGEIRLRIDRKRNPLSIEKRSNRFGSPFGPFSSSVSIYL